MGRNISPSSMVVNARCRNCCVVSEFSGFSKDFLFPKEITFNKIQKSTLVLY
jgi:hypothetical protein